MFSVDDLDFELEDVSKITFRCRKPLNQISRYFLLQEVEESTAKINENEKSSLSSEIFRKPSIRSGNVNVLKHKSAKKNDLHDSPVKEIFSKPMLTMQRKFPGPAGLLPDKPPRSFNDASILIDNAENHLDEKQDEPIFCSQSTELTFSEPPFKRLKKDFDVDSHDSALCGFTVDWVKKKTMSKKLMGQKIPFLAVILQLVDCSSPDPLITLRDRTGELLGTLHSEGWKEMSEELRPGAAIVLKEVGVLSTGITRRQVILNITRNNIVSIYTPTDDGEVLVNKVQTVSSADLVQSVREWQAKAVQISSPARISEQVPSPRPNLFPKLSSSSPLSTKPFQVPRTSEKESVSNTSNFELFDDDEIFESLQEVSDSSLTAKVTNDISLPKPYVGNFQTPNVSNSSSFGSPSVSNATPNVRKKACNYVQPLGLSQVESSILDEVLSGVDLDDFA